MRSQSLRHMVLGWAGAIALAFDASWAAAQASPTVEPAPLKIMIDTDIGDDIDDSFAVAWALANPRFHVVAITSAWGDTALRDRMLQRLLQTMGRSDVSLGHGIVTKNPTPFTQRRWAEAAAPPPAPLPDAVDLMLERIRHDPGAITLVALAPLTNIGALLDRDPDAFRQLKAVVIMSGSVVRGYNKGNGAITGAPPSAEYNAAMDPASLRKLLASGVPVTLFPLDSTQVKLQEIERDRLLGNGGPTSEMLASLYHQWKLNNQWGQLTPTLFDVVPLAALIDSTICPARPMRIEVSETGRTTEVPGPANAGVCLTSRGDAVVQAMTSDLLGVSR